MKVLIIGGTGFLGKTLALNLAKAGHTPMAVGRKYCDMMNYDKAKEFVSSQKPDHVVILAAYVGGIGKNLRNPALMFYNNMTIGLHAIHMCYELDVPSTYLGTCCSYPKHAELPFKEERIWEGYPEETNAPYGVVKRSMAVMADAYRRQYGYNCNYLIPANLYGPCDNFDLEDSHVIPAMIRKFHEAKVRGEKHVKLWGTGGPTREFLYVDDCADAIRLSIEHEITEPVNIGNGIEVSMGYLAARIAEIVDFDGVAEWDTSKPDGQPRRCLDVTKAESLFGFKAKTTLQEGLIKTYDWFRNSI